MHTFVPLDSRRIFVYGGLNDMCQPQSDAYILTVNDDDHGCKWEEFDLAYDHGVGRCWHGAIVTEHKEVVIHSGLTQEYYLNRIQLDDHAEDILHFNGFGPKSLFRIAIEIILKTVEHLDRLNIPLDVISKLKSRRENGDQYYHEIEPPKGEDHFDRVMIHEGI